MKENIRILLKRAESFIKDALENLKRGDYDLAMFHVEQACQLIIKAKLLDLTGYFERTHSLRRLLKDLSTIFKQEELEKFIDENWTILRNLEYAYIASRYLPEEFKKDEVDMALRFYKKLKNLLWSF